jgi:hypothetical protein
VVGEKPPLLLSRVKASKSAPVEVVRHEVRVLCADAEREDTSQCSANWWTTSRAHASELVWALLSASMS